MSGRRRFICPDGFHRAVRLRFRAFDAVKLVTSGASPIAQMSGAVSKDRGRSRLRTSHVGGDGRGIIMAWLLMPLKRFPFNCDHRSEDSAFPLAAARSLSPSSGGEGWGEGACGKGGVADGITSLPPGNLRRRRDTTHGKDSRPATLPPNPPPPKRGERESRAERPNSLTSSRFQTTGNRCSQRQKPGARRKII